MSHSGFNFNPIIRREKTFPNLQEAPLIQDVTLLAYRDGRYCILVNPVNHTTAIAIKKKIKEADTSLSVTTYELAPCFIQIHINNSDDLYALRQLIDSMEHMPDAWYETINDTYDQFRSKSDDATEHPHAQKTTERKLLAEEKELYRKIDSCDPDAVKTLLEKGISPNPPLLLWKSPLMTAVYEYFNQRHLPTCSKKDWFTIIKLLLDYGADINTKHEAFNYTPLSIATDHHDVELVDLLLKYDKKVQFTPCKEEDAPHRETIEKLNEHFSRITFFSKLAKKDQHIKTEVELASPNASDSFLAKTKVKRDNVNLEVETYLTTTLSDTDLEQLFKLYQNNFSAKSESTIQLQQKHFYDKLGIKNSSSPCYIDVIKEKNIIVGFNLYQCYQGQFEGKPYQIVYCSLAYVEKPFRGTRIMSLLSFRGPFALKQAHPDIETYIFYDAIHPNSYRQAWNLSPRYPECRVDGSLNFVKQVTKQIYGETRANQYDGKIDLFWPTDARVASPPIKLSEYDLPCVIEKFDELTHGQQGVPGKGGVPVMIPVISCHFQQLEHDIDHKLNNTIFREHVIKLANLLFKDNHITYSWHDTADCLWPNNPIISNRLIHG